MPPRRQAPQEADQPLAEASTSASTGHGTKRKQLHDGPDESNSSIASDNTSNPPRRSSSRVTTRPNYAEIGLINADHDERDTEDGDTYVDDEGKGKGKSIAEETDNPPAKIRNIGSRKKNSKDSKTDGEGETETEKAGLDRSLPPITSSQQFFRTLVTGPAKEDTKELAEHGGFHLRVGTMCSGTDSPILGLDILNKEFIGQDDEHRSLIEVEHVYSVELVPAKQYFIHRNMDTTVFQDVRDFAGDSNEALTAFGSVESIPSNLDMLIAGTPCVDFSSLNSLKKRDFSITEELKPRFAKAFPGSNKKAEQDDGDENTTKESKVKVNEEAVKELVPKCQEYLEKECLETLKDQGQSSAAFFGMLLYVNKHRPKVVVLENVTKAPWTQMTHAWFPAISYKAVQVKVDSKDFGVPQTRTRGYLVAVDLQLKLPEEMVEEILDRWPVLLKKYQRRASSAIDKWLLPSTHPYTQISRQDEEGKFIDKKHREKIPWIQSARRHNRARRLAKIADRKPLTHWKQGGGTRPYDRLDEIMVNSQPARVLDCIEIYFLSGKEVGRRYFDSTAGRYFQVYYDILHKTRVIDLSQNVDRNTDGCPFGMSPCITPDGIPFASCNCRLINGYEALHLQGLPIMRMVLDQDQDTLRDLAGNAMTTTVVGSASLALFKAIDEVCQKYNHNFLKPIPNATILPTIDHRVLSGEEWLAPENAVKHFALDHQPNLQKVIEMVKSFRRYCYCNGIAKYSSKHYQQCKDCGTIRCTWCAGNPPHNYKKIPAPLNPRLPGETEIEVLRLLPGIIMHVIQIPNISPVRHGVVAKALAKVQKPLHNAVFYYTQTFVTEVITACYTAGEDFELRATMSEHGVTWNLFLVPSSALGRAILTEVLEVDTRKYHYLEQPFARSVIPPNSKALVPVSDSWEFWSFAFEKVQLEASKFTVPDTRVGLYDTTIVLSRLDPEEATYSKRAQEILMLIEGVYGNHPNCDAAESSLHKSKTGGLFLFKDPFKTLHPSEDKYVVSDSCRLLETHEYRQNLIRFDLTYEVDFMRPQRNLETMMVSGTIEGWWMRSTELDTIPSTQPVSMGLDPMEVDLRNGHLWLPPANAVHQYNPSIENDVHHKAHLLTQFIFSLPKNCSQQQVLAFVFQKVAAGEWLTVPRADHYSLHQILAPFNAKIAGKLKASDLELDHEKCVECSPQKPEVAWIIMGKQNKPYESPDEMKKFRAAYENRRKTFEVQISRDLGQPGGSDLIKVRYLYRPNVLVHRALANLPPVSAAQNVELVNTELSAHVQVCVAVDLNYSYRPFRRSIVEIRHETMADEDPHFITPTGLDLGSIRKPKNFKGELSPFQIDYVKANLAVEWSPEPFAQTGVEEELAPHISVRFVGKAKRIIKCRGGVNAAAVGFGKTVSTLALMAIQHGFDRSQSIFQRAKRMRARIHVAATLVIAPEHLLDQWRKEAQRFLGPDRDGTKFLLIYSSIGLAKLSHEDIKRAELVIVSVKLFSEEKYLLRLAKYGGHGANPDLSESKFSDRRFREWKKNSLAVLHERMETHMEHLRLDEKDKSRLGLIEGHIKQMKADDAKRREEKEAMQKTANDFEEKQARWTSKADPRIGDNEGEDGTQRKRPKQKGEVDDEFKPEKLLHEDYPLMEYFSFSRIVYDEFSYTDTPTELAVKDIESFSKWTLSATPPTRNLEAIARIAGIIGVHVAHPLSQRLGLPHITVGPTPDADTNTEQLLTQGKHRSDQYIQERQEQGHAFLRHFSIQCPFDANHFGKVGQSEVVIVNGMTTRETTNYLNAQINLQNVGLDAHMVSASNGIFLPHIEERGDMNGQGVAGRQLTVLASCGLGRKRDHMDVVESSTKALERSKKETSSYFYKVVFLHRLITALILPKNPKDIKVKDALGDSQALVEDLIEGRVSPFGGWDGFRTVLKALFPRYQSLEDLREYLTDQGEPLDTKELFERVHRMRSMTWTEMYRVDPSLIPHMTPDEINILLNDVAENENLLRLPNTVEGRSKLLEKVVSRFQEEYDSYRKSLDEVETNQELTGKYARLNKQELTNECDSRGIKTNTLDRRGEIVTRLIKDDKGVLPIEQRVEGRYSTFLKGDYPDLLAKITKRNSVLSKPLDDFINTSNALDAAIAHTTQCVRQLESVKVLEGGKRCCRVCGSISGDMYLVPECGHVLCNEHFEGKSVCSESRDDEFLDDAPSKCPSELQDRAVRLSRLAAWTRPSPVQTPGNTKKNHSSKTAMIMKTIKETPEGDGVVLFVQYSEQKAALVTALKEENITYTEDPQVVAAKDDQGKHGKKVLLLTLENSEAAGTNLQYFANHAMFASPLCTDLQEQYDGIMEQAKGRCVRYGQKKHVKIYHFVTANTIEVDMLELRRKQHIYVVPSQSHGRFGPTKDFILESDIALPDDEDERQKRDADGNIIVEGAEQEEAESIRPKEERVNSILSAKEVWKTMNERNWLKTIGIER